MTWATGYMLGITTGLCLQVAAVAAERRRTRQKLTTLVQDARCASRTAQAIS